MPNEQTSHDRFEADREARFLKHLRIPHPYVPPKPKRHPKPDRDKILVLPDLHEPYADSKVIRAAEGEKDAYTLIMPGDVGDFYSKSRFNKNRQVSFRRELRSIFKRLEWASTNFNDVRVMLGNHDNRPEKMILGRMQNGAVDLLMLTEQDLLKHLASFFNNIHVVGTPISGNIELTHVYQHGDIIFTHAEISRAQPSAILERISIYLFKWRRTLRLKPYRVIAQAHNHQSTKTTEDGETLFLMPCGMRVKSAGGEYIFSSRLIGKPPQIGYTVFHQKNGRTDINRSYNWIL